MFCRVEDGERREEVWWISYAVRFIAVGHSELVVVNGELRASWMFCTMSSVV